MIKAGVIGATGYAGIELVRILLGHPEVEKIFTGSVNFEGKNLTDVYPALIGRYRNKTDGLLLTPEEVAERSDIVFTALPHGIAEKYADYCVKNGKKLIDLSADFRFGTDEETFKKWYKEDWKFPEVHKESVYGLPEMNREEIKNARIIGNPGCYVTSATLALLPALKAGIIDTSAVIVDSKSGVTGSGRTPTDTNNFSSCGESLSAYKIGSHRHKPEIERNCSFAANKEVNIIFTPHLVPMSRGIVSTVYANFTVPASERIALQAKTAGIGAADVVRNMYRDFFAKEPFVRILPPGTDPQSKNVRFTNFCDIQVYTVNDSKMLEIISTLDNMVKGASGQAVQNMNLMFGFEETSGIDFIPYSF
ncbi:N-acetyl-gamma-glutamyl-phosphate reductase [Treponema parvum]|uniref:N-acetyl-gamma-glutamyl-phosphate reductase n=1 Tax=Treponema parvum TaxID=138851 RepID=UPI001FEBBD46|nr:N-acetyl-gamma-glutamyl-phosphate reductase [Treponema parvum]